MKYSKFVAPLMAGALALSMGLAGCGAQNTTETAETVVEETTGETEAVDNTTGQGSVEENTTEQQTDGSATVVEETTGETEAVDTTTGEENVELTEEQKAKIAELEETNKGHYVLYSDWYGWYDEYVADMYSWTTAFTGYTNNNETLYYAENATGTEAVLFVVSPNSRYYTSYAGDVVMLGNHRVAIVDDYTGNSFQFTVNSVDSNGNVYISLGNYGYGTFSPCAVSDVISAMDAVESYGYDLKYW